MTSSATRDDFAALDEHDPLRLYRERFELPEGVIYLDGNSLGPLPKAVKARMREVVETQWGQDLITAWNLHDWVNLPGRVGAKIARLIGAESDEVIAADSTSINLFKLLAGALAFQPERRVIVSDSGNFPTDLYMVQGVNEFLAGRYQLRFVDRDLLPSAIDQQVAMVLLTHVDYRSGARYDMRAMTALAHRHGALMLWDLAHSAGALALDLNGCDADLAVGCGYKYLNGGPGAPAFLFAARRLQAHLRPVLSGWFGHATPFAFSADYAPATAIRRMLCGTPPILSLAALDTALEVFADIDLQQIEDKSAKLTQSFIDLVETHCAGFGLELATSRAPAARGSQVSFTHPEGYAIVQALIARGVIGDFRAPNIARFGFAPLYLRHQDVWDAAMHLRDVLATRAWDTTQFKTRSLVT
jgi:kynureninase